MNPSTFRDAFLAAVTQEDLDQVLRDSLHHVASWASDESLGLFQDLPSLVDRRNASVRARRDPEQALLLDRLSELAMQWVLKRFDRRSREQPDVAADHYNRESKVIQGKLRDLGLPEPHYSDTHSWILLEFARALLSKINDTTTPSRITLLRETLEGHYQDYCFDLPAHTLKIVLREWDTDPAFLEMGLDAPFDYFEQLRLKAGAAHCLPFVGTRLCTCEIDSCRKIVYDFLPHARGNRSILQSWHEVLCCRSDEDSEPEFGRLAEDILAYADLSHPVPCLEEYLCQDRPDAEALSLARHALRSAGSMIEIRRSALERLLARDSRFLDPEFPPDVRDLLHGDAGSFARDYLAMRGISRPSPQTTCGMLTLCLQRFIADALCRTGDLSKQLVSDVNAIGLGGIVRLIRGDHVSELDGIRVCHALSLDDFKHLERVLRIRNDLHHPQVKLQPQDARLLHQLVFENVDFLKRLAGMRLRFPLQSDDRG